MSGRRQSVGYKFTGGKRLPDDSIQPPQNSDSTSSSYPMTLRSSTNDNATNGDADVEAGMSQEVDAAPEQPRYDPDAFALPDDPRYDKSGNAIKIAGRDEDHWYVETILASKHTDKRGFQYLIRWVGPQHEDTWNDAANLVPECVDMLLQFHRKYPDAEGPTHFEQYADYSRLEQLFGVEHVEEAKKAGKFQSDLEPTAIDEKEPMATFVEFSREQMLYAFSKVEQGRKAGNLRLRES